jgi:hypothetical protein
MADDADALVARVGAAPDDESLREAAARALSDAGRGAEAARLLTGSLKNLASHTTDKVPCLCRRCLDPERESLVVDGLAMRRDFLVAAGRVLFFWRPAELATDVAALRDRMRAGLAARLTRTKNRRPRSDDDDDDGGDDGGDEDQG